MRVQITATTFNETEALEAGAKLVDVTTGVKKLVKSNGTNLTTVGRIPLSLLSVALGNAVGSVALAWQDGSAGSGRVGFCYMDGATQVQLVTQEWSPAERKSVAGFSITNAGDSLTVYTSEVASQMVVLDVLPVGYQGLALPTAVQSFGAGSLQDGAGFVPLRCYPSQWTPVKLAAYTAVAGQAVPLDTGASDGMSPRTYTVELPESPQDGDSVRVVDITGGLGVITVSGNGERVQAPGGDIDNTAVMQLDATPLLFWDALFTWSTPADTWLLRLTYGATL